MTQDYIIGMGMDALWTAIKVSAPLLGVILVVGVVVGVIQAVTQVQEATLAMAGPWMLNTLVAYSAAVFESLPVVAR